MVGRGLRARPGRLSGSAEEGALKDRPRLPGQRPRRGSKRAGDATKRACRAVELAVEATKVLSQPSEDKEIEECSVDDVGAEFMEYSCAASAEEEVKLYQRLYKKRSNMALALYHKNHPDEQYKLLRVCLNDIFNFMEYRLKHPFNTHMNFVALDVKTGLEKLFFAELCMINDMKDGNSGYAAITCEIVDDSSPGGRNNICCFADGKYPPDYYDGENCYACMERIKHPPGVSYRAGHDVFGYGM